MFLKKLILNNFRQYKGEQTICFSSNREKNVTVFLGKNTSGKTTLIQSFYWVLYGKTNFDTKDFMLNLEVANSMSPGDNVKIEVILELIHNDIEYTISRTQMYSCYSKGNVKPNQAVLRVQHKLSDGRTDIRYSDCEDTINNILPEELSDYFFFDGERIGFLGKNDTKGKKDLAKAVKGILGLNVLDSAIAHLTKGPRASVLGKFKNSIDTAGNENLSKLKRDNDHRKDKLESIRKRIEDLTSSILYYEEEIEKNEKILKDNENTSALKKEMNINEVEISRSVDNKNNKTKKIVSEFSKKAPMFFMQPLLTKAIDMIQCNDMTDEGIPEMHSKSVDFLISRGRCICGREIVVGGEVHQNLIKQKNFLPPQTIGTMLGIFMNNAKNYRDNSLSFITEISSDYKELRKIKTIISELISSNETLSNQISGKLDIGKIEDQVKKLKKDIKILQAEKEDNIGARAVLDSEIRRTENEINEKASAIDKNRFILQCIEYTEFISEQLQNHYSSMEKVIRRKLELRVNQIFSRMYHGDRKIIIDEQYEYTLSTPNIAEEFQSKADESKGLETVTSFAFISGIVSLAKEKIEKDIDLDPEPYPLVMDAPFSNADEHHVESVSEILPEVAEQVIMFIMHKDWNYASKVLNNKVERMYELEKQSETFTIIRGDK